MRPRMSSLGMPFIRHGYIYLVKCKNPPRKHRQTLQLLQYLIISRQKSKYIVKMHQPWHIDLHSHVDGHITRNRYPWVPKRPEPCIFLHTTASTKGYEKPKDSVKGTEEAQAAINQAEKDVAEYAKHFDVYCKVTHPDNLDLRKPLQELVDFTKAIRVDCLTNIDETVKVLGEANDEEANLSAAQKERLLDLRTRSKRIADESEKVLAGFTKAVKELGDYVTPSANMQAQSKAHTEAMTAAMTKLDGVIAATRKQIADRIKPMLETYRGNLAQHQRELKEIQEKLVSAENLKKTYQQNLGNAGQYSSQDDGGSAIGSFFGGEVEDGNIKSLQESQSTHMGTVADDEECVRVGMRELSTYEIVVEDAQRMKQKLLDLQTGANDIHLKAEEWRLNISNFSKEWQKVHNHITDITSATHSIEDDSKKFLPQRAVVSKHVLNAVDQSSRFARQPGVIELLRQAVDEITKANDWTDKDEEIEELKFRLQNENAHLAKTEAALKDADATKLLPEPLGLGSGKYDRALIQ